MKRLIYVAMVAIVCLSASLAFAGSFSRGGGSFSSRSFSPSSRPYSSPSFSVAPKPYTSPSFSAARPTPGPYSSKSFTPSRPIASAPSLSTGNRPGYSYSRPGTVVEHHYYNSGPSMGHFWFWMWALDRNNNSGGYYNGYPAQGGAVVPGGAIAPVIPVYTPLWERLLVGFVNLLLVVGVVWLIIWGIWKISKAVD